MSSRVATNLENLELSGNLKVVGENVFLPSGVLLQVVQQKPDKGK